MRMTWRGGMWPPSTAPTVTNPNDILFSGTVDLLSLRGGGPPLAAEDSGSISTSPNSAAHHTDESPTPAATMGYVRQAVPQWEQRAFEESHDRDHQRWLDDNVAGGSSAGGGVRIAPWALVTGMDGHSPIRVCPRCHMNRADGPLSQQWRQTRTGLMVCDSCFYEGTIRPQPAASSASAVPQGTQEPTVSRWNLPVLPSQAEPEPAAPPNTHRTCAACASDLTRWGSTWRICRCRAVVCADCWSPAGGCPACSLPLHEEDRVDSARPLLSDDDPSDDEGTAAVGWGSYPSSHPEVEEPAVAGTDQRRLQLLTPAEAVSLRERNLHEHQQRLQERKARSRSQARTQTRCGTRPPRPPECSTGVNRHDEHELRQHVARGS